MDVNSILILAAVLILAFLVSRIAPSKYTEKNARNKAAYRYRQKEYIMTQSESDFFKTLDKIIDGHYYLFPQVHLSAILDHAVKGQNWNAALRHINGKSVDYVICDKQTHRPLLAIELDDWSHAAQDRKSRDAEVERILAEAEMPLLRIERWRKLTEDQIFEQVKAAIHQT